jgi:hypothetical protein
MIHITALAMALMTAQTHAVWIQRGNTGRTYPDFHNAILSAQRQ